MRFLFLVCSVVCGLVATCVAFRWLGVDANYNGFLALAIVFLALSEFTWPPYFRR